MQVYKQPVPHVQQGVQEPLAPTLAVHYRQQLRAQETASMQQTDLSRYSEDALALKKQEAASWFETAKQQYASRRHHNWSYSSKW
jgi:type IV secretory pathway VirB9-like protein